LKLYYLIPLVLGLVSIIYFGTAKSEIYRNDVVVLYPTFTQSAYLPGGFYDHYAGTCKECLTVPTNQSEPKQMSSSRNAYHIFKDLGYTMISDQQLDSNPKILQKYNKVIVLHNEYVTQKEFDAIISHPNVLYLYPNSLYAKIRYDGKTITLLQGHRYPNGQTNGFGWKDDTTRFEMDRDCKNIQFVPVSNGVALDCYPEYSMISEKIWKQIAR